ncbi:O-antigen ligase family protein [Aeromonas caviae]|uniref:O-antigen ligase family protein n=1 Tax=Aeromonas caviae TaxID=648 RepID=UPI00069B9AEC|nr:O-antigen ligase family protein [Aeromonas caviae]MDX7648627.1 O-antigen ligase family protein [Aeromonas caviae]QQM74401.1 O-antigen ligase family protein [Aeromonas caviae]QQV20040.1 O-antigen ligase family protein [Aeromonas caviae]
MILASPIILPLRINILHNLVQVSAFLFGALALTIPSGYSYGPAILLLASITVCWRPFYWVNMPREVKILALIFFAYVFVQGLSIWLDGGKLREFDRPSRVLMAAITLPLLSRYPVRLVSLIFGVAVGACIAGSIAIYDKFYLGMERAFGDIMPIQAGNISMTLGLLCLCGYFWYKSKGNIKTAMFMLFACAMGMLGSFLSGTRGGWVLLPIIILTIVNHFRGNLCRIDKIVSAVFGLGLLAIVAIPQTGVAERIHVARSDIVQFMDGGNKNTSIGIRFQLWYSAFDAFQKKPLFGWGNNGLQQAHTVQLAAGEISEFLYKFNFHAHNQFLDEMAKRGLIGLLVLLIMYLYPLYLFYKHRRGDSLLPIMLAVTSLTLIDYSLSQAFISHNSGITFVSFLFLVEITMLNNSAEIRKNNEK